MLIIVVFRDRYELFLDTMILTGTYDVDPDYMEKICSLATRNGHVKMVGMESLEKVYLFFICLCFCC